MKTLKVFRQQSWHPQHDVSIHQGAIVAVDGVPVNTEREQALANIILRLNSGIIVQESIIDALNAKILAPTTQTTPEAPQ